jgi:heptosyltransferase-2
MTDKGAESMRAYKNILVRGVNRIGDTIFSLPALKALRQGFPDARVTVLVKPVPAGLFGENPSIDEVILFEDTGRHRGVAGRLRLVSQLRNRRFDLALLFHNCFDAALVPFLAGIPERVGYIKEHRGILLTKKLPFPRETLHQVDHYLRLVSLLGISTDDRMPELWLSPAETGVARAMLQRKGVGRPLIGFIPGAVARTRRWHPERFAALGDKLCAETGGSVLLLGGPGDREISTIIEEHMASPAMDLTGSISVRQLMAIMNECDLIVSNDTGPMHVAWTLGRPVVTFVGAADIREIAPLGPDVYIIRKDLACSPCIEEECPEGTAECLELISVDEVFETARTVLKKHAA